MRLKEPPFTLGVEEEYLLVDPDGNLVSDPPKALMEECVKALGEQVSSELMRAQIEVGTPVCRNVKEVRSAVRRLRHEVAEIAQRFDCAPIAASTHPFGRWLEQKQTEKERYSALTQEMQATARRLLICGMHVHVGIDDPDLRIDLMSQLSYFLPHLLALSCSSPFWEGENTGLKSYRLTVFDALPRTGLPEQFASYAEYERHVQVMVDAGLVEDASMIWWDLRPSCRFPTLETRIMDVMTDVEHAMSLVALDVCLLRMLYRTRVRNQRWRVYAPMLINENRWRAMRYSFDEGLIDLAKGEVIDYQHLLGEIMAFVMPDSEALGCIDEIEALTKIIDQGTSAHHQVRIFDAAIADGKSEDDALRQVVQHLVSKTVDGL